MSRVTKRYAGWAVCALLTAALAVTAAGCGGGGGSGDSTPGSKLFVVDGGNHAIASIINPAPAVNSPITIDRTVQGSSTGLGLPGGTPSWVV